MLLDAGAPLNTSTGAPSRTPLDSALVAWSHLLTTAATQAAGKALVCEREARVRLRVAKTLLRAGARTAALPTAAINDQYIRRVLEAGGFRAYERNHVTALTATFAPKIPALPSELVRHIVAFAFHAGYY